MWDLVYFAALLVPPIFAHGLGWRLSRGFTTLTPEVQARRLATAEWAGLGGLLVQWVGTELLSALWPDRLPAVAALDQAGAAVFAMARDGAGHWVAVGLSLVVHLGLIVGMMVLMLTPWQRLHRLAKGLGEDAGAARQQRRLLGRSLLVILLPAALSGFLLTWASLAWALDATGMLLLSAGWILLIFALAPVLLRLSQPTRALPESDPLTQRVRALCQRAGVRVSAVRVIATGPLGGANAMVSGIVPGFRTIALTEHLLACFTPEEIDAILAHELGHIKRRHLWGNLLFALTSLVLLPNVTEGLARVFGTEAPVLLVMAAYFVVFGLGFSFLARRFEAQADRYAVALTGDAPTFARALEKLAHENRSRRRTGLAELLNTHPDIAKRIAAVMSLPLPPRPLCHPTPEGDHP